jgi:hypothetical protein
MCPSFARGHDLIYEAKEARWSILFPHDIHAMRCWSHNEESYRFLSQGLTESRSESPIGLLICTSAFVYRVII